MLHGFFYNYMYKKTPCPIKTRSFFETMEFRLVCFARIYFEISVDVYTGKSGFFQIFFTTFFIAETIEHGNDLFCQSSLVIVVIALYRSFFIVVERVYSCYILNGAVGYFFEQGFTFFILF